MPLTPGTITFPGPADGEELATRLSTIESLLGNISGNDLPNGIITEDKIATDAISSRVIAPRAVTGAKVALATLGREHFRSTGAGSGLDAATLDGKTLAQFGNPALSVTVDRTVSGDPLDPTAGWVRYSDLSDVCYRVYNYTASDFSLSTFAATASGYSVGVSLGAAMNVATGEQDEDTGGATSYPSAGGWIIRGPWDAGTHLTADARTTTGFSVVLVTRWDITNSVPYAFSTGIAATDTFTMDVEIRRPPQ